MAPLIIKSITSFSLSISPYLYLYVPPFYSHISHLSTSPLYISVSPSLSLSDSLLYVSLSLPPLYISPQLSIYLSSISFYLPASLHLFPHSPYISPPPIYIYPSLLSSPSFSLPSFLHRPPNANFLKMSKNTTLSCLSQVFCNKLQILRCYNAVLTEYRFIK